MNIFLIIILILIGIGVVTTGVYMIRSLHTNKRLRTNASQKSIKQVQFSNAILLPEVVKMLDEGHTVTLLLKGYSMRPFLEDNRDKALLTKA